jgi:large subunit ribosomal protein L28
MSKICQVTGKRPVTGNNVLSAKGMRIIDKKGIDAVLAEMRQRGEKI